MRYDVFISHASDDKAEVASPLAYHLTKRGLRVWIDDFELTIGDSLRRSIDRGLAESRFGIIILSPNFFKKEWPKRELDGLVAREDGSEKIILPIWHNVTKDDVTKFSPILADKLAVSTERGIDHVVQEVLRAVNRQVQHDASQTMSQNLEEQKAEELSQIRKSLLIAGSIRDLRVALYKVDEFLSKYPKYYEARLLKSEIRAAIYREEEPAPSKALPPPMARRALIPSIVWLLLALLSIAGVSYLVYLLIRWILKF